LLVEVQQINRCYCYCLVAQVEKPHLSPSSTFFAYKNQKKKKIHPFFTG